MNEIRRNAESEKILASAKCKMPKLLLAAYIIAISVTSIMSLLYLIGEILYVNSDEYYTDYDGSGSFIVFLIVSLFLLIMFIVFFVLSLKAIKKSKCIITNKRIYGTKAAFITRRDFSYRLDMIDNVEVQNRLGVNMLVITFSQRNVNLTNAQPNLFIMNYIEKSDEFFNAASNVLMSVKNDKDVKADIEIKKIEAQARQADAFMRIADNISNKQTNQPERKDDYISQLQRLKQLLDSGVITQQDFNEKKEQLLKQ